MADRILGFAMDRYHRISVTAESDLVLIKLEWKENDAQMWRVSRLTPEEARTFAADLEAMARNAETPGA